MEGHLKCIWKGIEATSYIFSFDAICTSSSILLISFWKDLMLWVVCAKTVFLTYTSRRPFDPHLFDLNCAFNIGSFERQRHDAKTWSTMLLCHIETQSCRSNTAKVNLKKIYDSVITWYSNTLLIRWNFIWTMKFYFALETLGIIFLNIGVLDNLSICSYRVYFLPVQFTIRKWILPWSFSNIV